MVEMLGDAPGTQAGTPTVFPLIAILASLFGSLGTLFQNRQIFANVLKLRKDRRQTAAPAGGFSLFSPC
jgi:hypothetical protein